MSRLIYGLFDNRAQAYSAISAIQSETPNEIHALVHEGFLRDGDMKIAGSSALRGAILGAAVVGSLAALIGALMVPSGRLDFGWSEAFFMAVAGMTLGVTAGAVAGASEPRRKLVTFTKRLNEGKVLVIMEAVEGLPTATILELLTENGAVEVSVA